MRPRTALLCASALFVLGTGSASAQPCYDPCAPRVGPVRRVLRRVFHPCCPVPPPPCLPAPVFVVQPPRPPVLVAPRAFVPPPAAIGAPFAPPAPVEPRPAPEPVPATGSSFRPPVLTPPLPPPAVRVDRIASAPSGGNALEGQVVSTGNAPRPSAELTLVHASRPELRQTVTTDSAGRFDVTLAAGAWRVYSRGSDGRFVLHGNVEVVPHQTCKVTVVGR